MSLTGIFSSSPIGWSLIGPSPLSPSSSVRSIVEASIQALDGDGLTLKEFVASIPHDGAALVLYAMLVGSVALVWWGHRNAGRGRPGFIRDLPPGDAGGGGEAPSGGRGGTGKTGRRSLGRGTRRGRRAA